MEEKKVRYHLQRLRASFFMWGKNQFFSNCSAFFIRKTFSILIKVLDHCLFWLWRSLVSRRKKNHFWVKMVPFKIPRGLRTSLRYLCTFFVLTSGLFVYPTYHFLSNLFMHVRTEILSFLHEAKSGIVQGVVWLQGGQRWRLIQVVKKGDSNFRSKNMNGAI